MPKWISVEEAAAKYGINKEVIWLWADMKRFPMSYEKVSPLLMKKALSDSCIRIRIELQPSISTHWNESYNLAPKGLKNRLTIEVIIFYCQPIVMAYCQHVNR